MLSVKEKKILKTIDYIIKNKKKDISPYLSKKLNTLTKLKGGSNNENNNENFEFLNALSSEEEVKKKKKLIMKKINKRSMKIIQYLKEMKLLNIKMKNIELNHF